MRWALGGKNEMEIETYTIRNRLGLHARAAALLVKKIGRASCRERV